MNDVNTSSRKTLRWGRIIGVIALLILCIAGALVYKLVWEPSRHENLISETSDPAECKRTYTWAHDAFTGYYVERLPEFRRILASKGICIDFKDDEADYVARHQAVEKGDFDFASFELTSYLKVSSERRSLPGVGVMLIDETRGADGCVGYTDIATDFDGLNKPDMKFVLPPNSPAEFLGRIAYKKYLHRISGNWFEPEDSAADVLAQMKADEGRGLPRLYCMWEPYLSEARDLPNVRTFIGSNEVSGMIIDFFMVRRENLSDAQKREDARTVIETYQRTLYAFSSDESALAQALFRDAQETKTKGVTREKALLIARGIEWKNVSDNYEAFGVGGGSPTFIESVRRVSVMLEATGVSQEFIRGKEHTIINSSLLGDMQASGFNPRESGVELPGFESRDQKPLVGAHRVEEARALSDAEWDQLVKVGNLNIADIGFRTSSPDLTPQGESVLRKLSDDMAGFPRYYILITGHARSDGDKAANLRLMEQRAAEVASFLAGRGLSTHRMRAIADRGETRSGGAAQSVSFTVLRQSY